MLLAGDDEGSPPAPENTAKGAKGSRRKDRSPIKAVSPSNASGAKPSRVVAPDVAADASQAPDEDEEAAKAGNGDSGSVSSGSEEDSDASGTSTSDDGSDIASDLEGLPVTSVVGLTGPSKKQRRKQAKPSASQVITEAGMASKLGVAFSRVLQRSSNQGIMQVRYLHTNAVPGRPVRHNNNRCACLPTAC